QPHQTAGRRRRGGAAPAPARRALRGARPHHRRDPGGRGGVRRPPRTRTALGVRSDRTGAAQPGPTARQADRPPTGPGGPRPPLTRARGPTGDSAPRGRPGRAPESADRPVDPGTGPFPLHAGPSPDGPRTPPRPGRPRRLGRMETPRTTYRLQVRPGFDLHRVAELTGHFADLGVDTLYLSPLLTSTTGSDHGYDGTDPTTIDAGRGGEAGWAALTAAAAHHGIRLLVDIVPNHLGVEVAHENPSWWSVLAEGEASPYADWYDIDWSRPITILVLADDAAVRDLRLVRADDGWELHYHEHRYPVAAGTVGVADSTDGTDPTEVHLRQHYRLIDWRRANTELSYRRFFAVNTLAGLRVEDPAVFDATHARVLRWV